MSPILLNGKESAARRKELIRDAVQQLAQKPCLAVVLVGDNPASEVYVGKKQSDCKEVGMDSILTRLPKNTTQKELLHTLSKLNSNPAVDGILLQLPLPAGLDTFAALDCLSPRKDVDGLTTTSQGLLAQNRPCFLPCTPKGIISLLDDYKIPIKGKVVAVVGRSHLVGSPIARLLTHRDASVITLHSKSENPQSLTRQADILVVAAGQKHLVDETWVKEGAVVIDVGMHRDNGQLCGDVDFAKVKDRTSFITPVPGGVGPMTVVSLLENCLQAAQK